MIDPDQNSMAEERTPLLPASASQTSHADPTDNAPCSEANETALTEDKNLLPRHTAWWVEILSSLFGIVFSRWIALVVFKRLSGRDDIKANYFESCGMFLLL